MNLNILHPHFIVFIEYSFTIGFYITFKKYLVVQIMNEEEKKELEYQHFASPDESKACINGCKHHLEREPDLMCLQREALINHP